MGAGAVVSNPSDLTIYRNLFKKIINESSLNQMTTIQDNYGMVFSIPFQERVLVRVDEFRSVLYYFPTDKIGCSAIKRKKLR
jgi:hypothetical protein